MVPERALLPAPESLAANCFGLVAPPPLERPALGRPLLPIQYSD